jgi:PAS domain S-box-containing protein
MFWGPQYVALYNDAYAPTIGDKHPAALGRPAQEFWSELWDDLEPLLRSVRETGETVVAADRPFYIERSGGVGEQVFFDISYSPVRGPTGEVEAVLCIVNETTDRVRAQREIAADRQRLASMFELAPSFMAVLRGPEHIFELTNRSYQRLVADRNVLGKTVREALPELTGQGFFELLTEVYETGAPYNGRAVKVLLAPPSGGDVEEHILDFIYQPILDSEGEVTAIFVDGSEVTDRERALEAHRDSEARLLAIADSVDQMIWSTRPDGFHDYFNQRWFDFTGVRPGASYGDRWLSLLHPEDRAYATRRWRESLESGAPYEIEYRLRHQSGAYRWVLGRGKSARGPDGAIQRWYGTCTDIHDLKLAEDALRSESNALEILNRTAAQVAAELDLDRVVQTVVDAGVELTGAQFGAFFYNVVDDRGESYTLYALAGAERSAFENFPMPRNTAVFAPTFEGLGIVRSDDIQQDPRYGQSEPYRGQPEGHLPVRSYLAVPVTLRSGEVAGGLFFGHEKIGVFTDRSERLMRGLAAQAAIGIDNARLFRSAQLLNQNLEAQVAAKTAERDQIWQVSQDLLGVADRDGVWRSVNPAWTRTLGWTAEEIVGRSSEWLEHPDDREGNREQMRRFQLGAHVSSYETRLRAKHGGYRTLSWAVTPLGDAIYCVARDVTLERERQSELAEVQERLRQSQKMETIGQLTGGVAHDFNNLLQIVTGNLDTIQRNLPTDALRLRRAADFAMSGAKRAATLTQRLLAFARRQPLSPAPLNPNRLVAGMSELLHRTLGETIEIQAILAPNAWRVEADANELENAILNLAVNARDAMPSGGKLTIETANTHLDRDYARLNMEVASGQYVAISVSDTGLGMDSETLQKVFEPFFTTKEVGKGTGLGLSMVYGFVKQSGGHVKIYSETGHGTTVRNLSAAAGRGARP